MRLLTALLDVLFPRACFACGADLCGTVFPHLCPSCLARIEPPPPSPCPRCAAPLGPYAAPSACAECRRLKPKFDGTVAVGRYEETLRELVVRMKYGRDADLAWPLGELLAETLRIYDRLPEAEVVVPVPMRLAKRIRRGFNQADLLAGEVARRLDLPLRRALRRVRARPAQAGLTLAARLAAQRRTMAARRGAVGNRGVLLVDDVMTTGATASEAARALKAAGATTVLVAVVARV